MASPVQIAANRANAQLSTGPVTPEGKTRVSQNAFKHGLTSKHFVVRDEDREEFEALRDSLRTELNPQGTLEELTFQEVLHASWNLQRFRSLEAATCLGALDDLTDPQTTTVLDRLSRYQARAQRAYFKAIQELRVLQTNRALRTLKLTEEQEADVPAIADINNLTKQTHSEVTAKAMDLAIQMIDYEGRTYQLGAIRGRAPVHHSAAVK